MTGVEAVSNGVSAFRSPAVVNARRTLTAIVAILIVLLVGHRVSVAGLWHRRDRARRTGLPEYPVAAGRRGGRPRRLLLRNDWRGADRPGPLCEHQLRRFPAAVPDRRARRLPAACVCHPWTAAGVLARHLRAHGVCRSVADDLRRDHRPADPTVCGRRLPGVHALASRHGRPLAARWRATHLAQYAGQRHWRRGHGRSPWR